MQPLEPLYNEMKAKASCICTGLDLIGELLPPSIRAEKLTLHSAYGFLINVVDITAPFTACYKVQKAFLDQYDFGHLLLHDIIHYCKEHYPRKLVITDCKIGDVAHTLGAYEKNLFDQMGSDGIVVNPFMGKEIFEFADRLPEKLFLMLVRTSNPGNGLIQDIVTANGMKLWEHILERVCLQWSWTKNVIPVLSFSDPEQISVIRERIPDDMPIFWAGYGVQQRSPGNLNSLQNKNNTGLLIHSSRAILYENYQHYTSWQDAVKANIINMNKAIAAAS